MLPVQKHKTLKWGFLVNYYDVNCLYDYCISYNKTSTFYGRHKLDSKF